MTPLAQLKPTQRSRSAYHEAGHFVVALALDSPALQVRALHIIESERHTGAVVTDSDGIYDWDDAREVCTILLAGFHAESQFSGEPMIEAAATDLLQAEELIRELSDSPEHWTTHAMEISARARRIVSMYWPAIDALARELLRKSHIDEPRARAIVAQFRPSPPPRRPRHATTRNRWLPHRRASPLSQRLGDSLRIQRAASGVSSDNSNGSHGAEGS
ncbi:MAG: hypothetical protein ACPHRO_05405 [Nannocystaceae bacterium]